MYIPKYYREEDSPRILAFLKQNNFAALVALDGEKPIATHTPVEVVKSENGWKIYGHISRANAQKNPLSITTRLHITTRLRVLLRDFVLAMIRGSFLQAGTGTLCMRAVGRMVARLTVVQNGREIGEADNFVADRTCHELPRLRCGERGAFF